MLDSALEGREGDQKGGNGSSAQALGWEPGCQGSILDPPGAAAHCGTDILCALGHVPELPWLVPGGHGLPAPPGCWGRVPLGGVSGSLGLQHLRGAGGRAPCCYESHMWVQCSRETPTDSPGGCCENPSSPSAIHALSPPQGRARQIDKVLRPAEQGEAGTVWGKAARGLTMDGGDHRREAGHVLYGPGGSERPWLHYLWTWGLCCV